MKKEIKEINCTERLMASSLKLIDTCQKMHTAILALQTRVEILGKQVEQNRLELLSIHKEQI